MIRGPIVPLFRMMQKYPEYIQGIRIPDKVWHIRMWYMHDQDVCTLIDVNEQERKVKVKNYTDKIMFPLSVWLKLRIMISIWSFSSQDVSRPAGIK